MGEISELTIRERAYQIWEREGRPHGRDFEHWVQAQVELVAEAAKGNDARKAGPPPAAKTAAAKPSRSDGGRARARVKKPA